MNGPMEISVRVSVLNIVLLVILLTIYSRIYKRTRAVFTMGLLFFVGMLMLHNLITVYSYFAMQPLYAAKLFPFFFLQ